MNYDMRIAHFEEAHAMLERELEKAEKNLASTELIHELKKKKLHVKDMIKQLMDDAGKEFK
jgi:hypothetical protein